MNDINGQENGLRESVCTSGVILASELFEVNVSSQICLDDARQGVWCPGNRLWGCYGPRRGRDPVLRGPMVAR